jgi:hypothetical protein
MDQVRLKKGRKQQQTCIDIATMLLRKGLQVEGSNVEWAARHSHTRDYRTMDFLVHPQQQAQEAAYAALAARVLTVGDYAVPLTMAPCAGPPAGCVQVQLHQLPLEYVRQGCMQLLLQCAGQQGEVRCEFLGGSSWCGDAALSCPAADTVVAWVKPPPGDLLLTKLPSSFQLLDGSKVLINVDGRPATQPSLWKQLSKQYEQKMQEAQQLCAKLARQQEEQRQQQQQQQQQPDQPNEAGSDVDMGPAPPLQPSQQQTDNTHNNTATDMQLDEEPAAHMQQQQAQQQQQQTQQQQRQQTQQQQRQQQQQEEAAARPVRAAARRSAQQLGAGAGGGDAALCEGKSSRGGGASWRNTGEATATAAGLSSSVCNTAAAAAAASQARDGGMGAATVGAATHQLRGGQR